MTKQEEKTDVLTEDLVQEALSFNTLPQRYYYPIGSLMWNAFLMFYTEEQLTCMGFIKDDHLDD